MSRHFRTRWPLRSQFLRLTEPSSVGPDSPRTSPGNETETVLTSKHCDGSGHHEHDARHDETIHDTVTKNQR